MGVQVPRIRFLISAAIVLLVAGCQQAGPPLPEATVGPTAIAKSASPAVPTIAAQASPAVASPIAKTVAPLQIVSVRTQPNDVQITLQNQSANPMDLSGYQVRVGTTTVRLPQAARIGPNERLTIHTAMGTTTPQDVYLGAEGAALSTALRPGARVALLDNQGNEITQFTVLSPASPSPSPAIGALRMTDLTLDPADPTLTLENTGTSSVDMTGWKIQVGTTTIDFPGSARIAPGEEVQVHLSEGTTTSTDIYIGREAATAVSLLTPGADVAILNERGQAVVRLAVPGR